MCSGGRRPPTAAEGTVHLACPAAILLMEGSLARLLVVLEASVGRSVESASDGVAAGRSTECQAVPYDSFNPDLAARAPPLRPCQRGRRLPPSELRRVPCRTGSRGAGRTGSAERRAACDKKALPHPVSVRHRLPHPQATASTVRAQRRWPRAGVRCLDGVPSCQLPSPWARPRTWVVVLVSSTARHRRGARVSLLLH